MTATPYALYALSSPWSGLTGLPAGFADGVDNSGDSVWGVADTNVFYNSGNVGIGGGASTTDRLAISGGNSIGTAVFGSTSKGANLSHIQFGPLGDWYIRSAASTGKVILQDSGGNVGIGTNSPTNKLHVFNTAGSAILGEAPNGNGVVGRNALPGNAATAGINTAQDGVGVFGLAELGSSAIGVLGSSQSGLGMLGASNINVGVKGTSNSNIGVQGVSASSSGVEGRSSSSEGVYGYSADGNGVYGYGDGTNGTGVKGMGVSVGVRGEGGYNGVYAIGSGSGAGIFANGPNLAGLFGNDVTVAGTLISNKSTFQIDHPLDPENKVLSHTSVESPEMLNIYSGNVITDATAQAVIVLPKYFEVLNIDFRYQLTVIGDFAQAIISKEIKNNTFEIKTDKPNVKVSWMVTGIRNDLYAKAHPMEVEKSKTDEERGKYVAPELYGKPKEMGIHYRPEMEPVSAPVSKVK